MKSILVTGGAGYVGAVLVPKLLKQGYQVKVLDQFLYADESIYSIGARQSGQLEIHKGDLCDQAFSKNALKGVECVINLAGISNDPSSDLNPDLTRKVNIEGTKQFIELSKQAGVKRFVSASSSSVYGIKDEPDVTEELSLEPLTIYSESKVAIEEYLAANRGSMTAVSIRSATVCGYSPRLRLDLAVNILTHHAVLKNKITVFGGSQKRPNIHIQDITDLYVSMVEAPAAKIDGEKFNYCGANHTLMELAHLVRDIAAPHAEVVVTPTNDLRSYHVSSEKIKKALGYTPKLGIGDAIRELAEAFRSGKIANPDDDRYYNVRTVKKQLAEWINPATVPNPELSR